MKRYLVERTMKIPKSPQQMLLGLLVIRIDLELSRSYYYFLIVPPRDSRLQSSKDVCLVLGTLPAKRRIWVGVGLPR